MRARIFQIDAFTSRRFSGNPAAVIPMARFPADAVMQAIAAENNLAETAFLVPEGGIIGCVGSRQSRKCPYAATPPWPARRSSWSGSSRDAKQSCFIRGAVLSR